MGKIKRFFELIFLGILWVLGVKHWFCDGWEPTSDDWRNPFWRWTEYDRIEVEEAWTLNDVRIGFKRKSDGKWIWWFRRYDEPWVAGRDSNFYNGIFTWNRTLAIGKDREGEDVEATRFNLVIRFVHFFWFAFGVGRLPDRGEFGWTGPWFFRFKTQDEHNPGVIAPDHEEGAVTV